MSTPDGPEHLSNHHRTTLRAIFQHPVSHNLEWRSVVSLLEAVIPATEGGAIVENHPGKLAVTTGGQTTFLEQPPGKDLDPQAVLDVRHLLTQAGYAPS
jgi:hypothetical protein